MQPTLGLNIVGHACADLRNLQPISACSPYATCKMQHNSTAPCLSKELRAWMYDYNELRKQGTRLEGLREQRLREELTAKQAEGAEPGAACCLNP